MVRIMYYKFAIALFAVGLPKVTPTTYNLNATQDVKITASPDSMHEGFTESMTLNCSFRHEKDSDFNTLMSLILSKSDPQNDSIYKEVATLSSVSRYNVNVKDPLGGQVTGQLLINQDSFISYSWQFPSHQVAGTYKCEAFGMDNTGHPRVSSAVTEVVEKEVDLSMILAKMRNLSSTQKDLLSQLTSQKVLIDAQNNQLHDVMSRLNDSLTSFTEKSSSYKGHHYHLMRPIVRNIAIADSQCRLYGGYLVEINDEQEFNFIVSLVYNVPGFIAVGATDEGHDGTWTFMHSGGRMTFFKWAYGQPDDAAKANCLGIVNSQMNDLFCNHDSHLYRFMCEIPS